MERNETPAGKTSPGAVQILQRWLTELLWKCGPNHYSQVGSSFGSYPAIQHHLEKDDSSLLPTLEKALTLGFMKYRFWKIVWWRVMQR